ncbi:HNH endonuclease [Burkholderia ambifaria IOP40-10]|uniref:HNH endonuclease n=1 Tax=Burkholderia ambifaria IOP40-10 TaxID=396596 RepID=B1FDV2_9BURK|nr:HNH endonuclease signature motif containing protein [Burkholderia ambifaria]EDT04242.1 HNH endonuclease [Burkholderia ambifaria IOP40-10]
MTKISIDQIKTAYAVAIDVYDGALSRADGVRLLHNDHGINLASAADFVENLRRMLTGQEFQRTLSVEATDYFLSRIAAERDGVELEKAIAASYAHLDYYVMLSNGGPQYAKRLVVDKWAAKQPLSRDLGVMLSEFEVAVERSRADTPAIRRRRLTTAEKIPKKVQVVTQVYVRNPDVVADVLERAKGACERCTKPAPFVRRRGDAPYLEVHHRKQLADGGEDTVENAIALCPNCHREMHYGKLD